MIIDEAARAVFASAFCPAIRLISSVSSAMPLTQLLTTESRKSNSIWAWGGLHIVRNETLVYRVSSNCLVGIRLRLANILRSCQCSLDIEGVSASAV